MSAGIYVNVQHTGLTKGTLPITDIRATPTEGVAHRTGPVYLSPGESIQLPYTGDVALSLDVGVLKGFLDLGYITVTMGFGETFSEALPTTSLPFTADGQLVTRVGGEVAVVDPGTEGQVLTVNGAGLLEWQTSDASLPFTADGQLLTQSGGDLTVVGIGTEGQVLTVNPDGTFAWQDPDPGLTAAEQEKLAAIDHGQTEYPIPLAVGSRNANVSAGWTQGMAALIFREDGDGEWRWSIPKLPGYTGGDAIFKFYYTLAFSGGIGDAAVMQLNMRPLSVGDTLETYDLEDAQTVDLESILFRTVQEVSFTIPEAILNGNPDVIMMRLDRNVSDVADTYVNPIYVLGAAIYYNGWGIADDPSAPE